MAKADQKKKRTLEMKKYTYISNEYSDWLANVNCRHILDIGDIVMRSVSNISIMSCHQISGFKQRLQYIINGIQEGIPRLIVIYFCSHDLRL